MAKSHERKIVDVRDLFGQAKEKVELPDPAPSSTGGIPSFASAGWGNGALGEYKPKACSSGNGDVFFGDPGPSSHGRRRHGGGSGPRVMIDMDVGIEEQLTAGGGDVDDDDGDDVRSAPVDPPPGAGPWSFGPPRMPDGGGSAGGGGRGGRGQLGPSGGRGVSRTGGSPGSAAGSAANANGAHSAMKGPAPGRPVNKYEGRPLPPPPTEANAVRSAAPARHAPVSPGGRPGGRDVAPSPMSNFSLRAKTPTTTTSYGDDHRGAHGRAGDVRGGGGGGRAPGGAGGGGSANSTTSLDQSSSGVETDDNGTPESTIQLTTRSAHPAAIVPPVSSRVQHRPTSPPQPPPTNGSHPKTPPPNIPRVPSVAARSTDSSYHSEEESDTEDEATLDFDDEDEEEGAIIEGNRRHVYREYHGDDYGQFLNDDPTNGGPVGGGGGGGGAAPGPGRRKRQRRRKKKDPAETTPGSTVSSNENATINKKRTLKGRLAAVFMGNANGASQKASAPEMRNMETGSTIHTFSFADSKIGNYAQQRPDSGGAGADPLYGSTSGCGNELAPCDAAYGGDRKWWSTDTLSARTLSSNSDVMLRSKRPSASSSNFMFGSGPSVDPAINGYGDNTDVGPSPGMDFESQRKSVIYGVHSDRRSQPKSIFRRFKKDTKPGLSDLIDNTVTNPLAAMEGEANDTRF